MYTIAKLITSMAAAVCSGSFSNAVCKKTLKTQGDIFYFNAYSYLAALVLFILVSLGKPTSLYTILMGLVFGLLTVISGFFKFRALATGPMHITTLVTTCQMIIPTMSGAIMFGEPFSMGKFIAMVFLIFFVYLSLDKSSSGKINTKWVIFCVICFFTTGAIGIMQKIHQNSIHKNELDSFLAVAFLCSFIFSAISAKRGEGAARFGVREYIFAVLCGIFSFVNNIVNLELSGVLPSQLFFPLVNGVPLVLSSVVAIVVFKEKLSLVQGVGLIGGTISLVAICLL